MDRLFYIMMNVVIGFQSHTQTFQSYNPPTHTGPHRLEQIKVLLPLMDSLYGNYKTVKNLPSLAYGILVDGQLVASNAFGIIQQTPTIPSNTKALYRIASMSKSVTAMCILQLRDAGKLRLDDPAAYYIPELKQNKLLTTDAPAITIRHLLNHAAGFPEDNPWGDRQLDDSNADLIALIRKGTHFSNVPGITYEYSNLGFAVLGQIVEKVSGMSLEAYTKLKIFKPLGMMHTEWEYTKVPANILAHGYRNVQDVWIEEPLLHHGSYGAMGGLITSIEDFSKYVALHMSAWPPRSDAESPVLKRSSLREMHRPANISGFDAEFKYASGRSCGIVTSYNYGLGWMRDCEGREYVGHSGGLPGFGSQWRFSPSYGIGVISFSNLTYAGLGGINLQVLDTLIQLAMLKPYAIPVSNVLNQRKSELLQLLPDWSAQVVARYASQKENIFSESFFPDYPLEDLRKSTQASFKRIGKIKTISEIRPENQLRGTFEIIGELGALSVFFTLTPENPSLIQELSWTDK